MNRPLTPTLQRGDQLRNQNAHEYLLNLYSALFSNKPPTDPKNIQSLFKGEPLPQSLQILQNFDTPQNKTLPTKDDNQTQESHATYQEQFAYGNLYTDFFTQLEMEFDNNTLFWRDLLNNKNKQALIIALFEQENTALTRTYTLIKDIRMSDTIEEHSSKITSSLNTGKVVVNNITPQSTDELITKLGFALTIKQFKPMYTTSQMSLRQYEWQKKCREKTPTEIRCGTWAQRTSEGYFSTTPRITPIAEKYLLIKALQSNQKHAAHSSDVTNVYFNLLGNDSPGFWENPKQDYERNLENKMTTELHHLENRHPNIAVITMPADLGLMDHKAIQDSDKQVDPKNAFKEMLDIACMRSTHPIKDFFISENVKKHLYGNGQQYSKNAEQNELKKLLTDSFQKILGIDPLADDIEKISPAQRHAIYFHFMKFEIPNFILNRLNPSTFNFSCKDGIDRAGVASLYFNFMKATELGLEFSLDEFRRGLHAASTLVKGRGINKHSASLWNALLHFCDTQKKHMLLETNSWIYDWIEKEKRLRLTQKLMKKLNNMLTEIESPTFIQNWSSGFFGGQIAPDNPCDENKTKKRQLIEKIIGQLGEHQDPFLQLTPSENDTLHASKSLEIVVSTLEGEGILEVNKDPTANLSRSGSLLY